MVVPPTPVSYISNPFLNFQTLNLSSYLSFCYSLFVPSPALTPPPPSSSSSSPSPSSPQEKERDINSSRKRNNTAATKMSGRRSNGSRITEAETNELIYKLQSLLPETRRRSMSRASASKLLKETCSYIQSLHREVDGLSDRLSDLMQTMDNNSAQAEIIRSLIR